MNVTVEWLILLLLSRELRSPTVLWFLSGFSQFLQVSVVG
jgi:hypothetical protein